LSVSMDELKRAVKEVLREDMEEKEAQESHVDHVCGCKDCWCDVHEKARNNPNFLYQCADCGLPIPTEMINIDGSNPSVADIPCSNCGSDKMPDPIQRWKKE